MAASRIRAALLRLPCSCPPRAPHAAYSSFASSSRLTLDDPLPGFDELAGRAVSGAAEEPTLSAPFPREQETDGGLAQGMRRRFLPAWLSSGSEELQTRQNRVRRPPNDRLQLSPYLPLFTRERNFLLANLRQALDVRPVSSLRSKRSVERGIVAERRSQSQDAAWLALARVLRYPSDVPALPHSNYPSSTRAPSADSPHDESTSSPSGFFTSSHAVAAPITSHDPEQDTSGRRKIALSIRELRVAFDLFASARPRTRNGFDRLLVVAELIAQVSPAAPDAPAQSIPTGAGIDPLLRGGGAGLRDRDWRALILFVGSCMRSPREDPEIKRVVELFVQWLRLPRPTLASTERPKTLAQARSKRRRDAERKEVYDALLFVAGRAQRWQLFEQVLARMQDDGVPVSGRALIELLRRESQRGADVAACWRIFEQALGAEDGTAQVQSAWAAMLWALARRGDLDDAVRLYEAMQAGGSVALDSLRPSSVPASAAVSPAERVVVPPPLGDNVYTALLQASAHWGDFAGALRVLRDVSEGGGAVQPAVHHYIPLFRAFVRFGAAPFAANGEGAGFDGGQSLLNFDATTLSGARIRAQALRRDSAPLAALTRSSARPARTAPSSSLFTLPALQAVLASFLVLPPPPASSLASLPHNGARTAPSSKHLFWVLAAFDKVTAGDSDVIVEVWSELERKFAGPRSGWSGWRVDKRVQKLVRRHAEAIEVRRRRLEELL